MSPSPLRSLSRGDLEEYAGKLERTLYDVHSMFYYGVDRNAMVVPVAAFKDEAYLKRLTEDSRMAVSAVRGWRSMRTRRRRSLLLTLSRASAFLLAAVILVYIILEVLVYYDPSGLNDLANGIG